MHYLERKQQLNCNLDQAWEFFSTPRNLDKLTPKSVGFKITHLTAEEMYKGQIIGYKIKIAPFTWVKWVTEITHVDNKVEFIDDQRVGPYQLWHHRHRFEKNDNGVLMRDEVVYAMPFGFLGQLVHGLFVKRQLQHIFNERARLCADVFMSSKHTD